MSTPPTRRGGHDESTHDRDLPAPGASVGPIVRPGRTLEWMVWQVATAADDDLGPMYRHDAVIPFAIEMDSLPRYPLLPTMLVRPDDID